MTHKKAQEFDVYFVILELPFASGTFRKAIDTAFMTISFTETLMPCCSAMNKVMSKENISCYPTTENYQIKFI